MADYLAWEPHQDVRHEFDGFEPVAIDGGTAAHHRIIRNGETALRSRLLQYEVFRETMKLRLAHTYRYPDLMVVCSALPGTATEVTDPVLVIEVLSDGNAREDRITKNEEYRQTPSIQHYVMLEQDSMAATVLTRHGDDWSGRIVTGPGAVLAFPELAVDVPLAAFYAGVIET
jgi:Uma2 family endonuclease